MEMYNEIILGLSSLISEDKDAVRVRKFGLPIVISVDISKFASQVCNLVVTCTPQNVELKLEPKDAVPGLVEFLNVQLKEDLQAGKIGRIVEVARCFFSGDQPDSTTDVCGLSSSDDGSSDRMLPFSIHYSSFEEERELGKGGYGSVFKCKHKIDSAIYAVKKVGFNDIDEKLCDVISEVEIMARLQHPYIVRYYQCWIEDGFKESTDTDEGSSASGVPDTPISSSSSALPSPPALPSPFTKTLYIAMEYCPGSLDEMIKNGLERRKVWKYFQQLVEAINFIHSQGVIHRDLSRTNIFIDANDNIKLADFGLAMTFDLKSASPIVTTSGLVGNPAYHAPELRTTPGEITHKADIFSLGLILYEMRHTMDTETERVTSFDKIRDGKFDLSTIADESGPLLLMLLERDPSKRVSAKELIEKGGCERLGG